MTPRFGTFTRATLDLNKPTSTVKPKQKTHKRLAEATWTLTNKQQKRGPIKLFQMSETKTVLVNAHEA